MYIDFVCSSKYKKLFCLNVECVICYVSSDIYTKNKIENYFGNNT